MRILAIIPVRGGSKGIPRKNMRLMDGRPLLYYSLRTAISCVSVTDIAVTTDDEEIKDYLKQFDGITVIDRAPELARDDVPLDPVVYDALLQTEKKVGASYDAVITIQATSPLLKTETLEQAVAFFLSSGFDTVISVSNHPHLAWGRGEHGVYPLYEKRLNRQYLPQHYMETGAFLIAKRDSVTESGRIGNTVAVYEMPATESIDIDSPMDWVQCEAIMKRKRIVFRTDAHRLLGMGHVYNCLTLAYNMPEHEVMFVCSEEHKIGIDKIRSSNFPCATVKTDEAFYEFLNEYKPDITVIDQLNTEADYIKNLKKLATRVVTIEDLGSGIYHADAVVNALYEDVRPLAHMYGGKKYVCLRDEFLTQKPKEFSPSVKNVFVMFGGTDPSNLTKKVYDMAVALNGSEPRITFVFAAGMGYDYEANGIKESEQMKILLFQDVKRLSRYMAEADIAFISQGRSVFEVASLGIPAIVMSQNEREGLHTFARMENGFLNLGAGSSIEQDTLLKTFMWLEQTPQVRAEMRRLQLRHDLRSGVKRVINIILGDYDEETSN